MSACGQSTAKGSPLPARTENFSAFDARSCAPKTTSPIQFPGTTHAKSTRRATSNVNGALNPIVELRLGRIHADGTKVNFNESKIDILKQALASAGFHVEVAKDANAVARSLALRRNGVSVGESTYDAIRPKAEVDRLVAAACCHNRARNKLP